jgi:hypothetical protein
VPTPAKSAWAHCALPTLHLLLKVALGAWDNFMSYTITHRYGAMEREPGLSAFPQLLAELKSRLADKEHGDVAVTHESEWCISVSLSGRVVFENIDHGVPRHMINVPEAKILQLWESLARGDLAGLEHEPWLPGYR